MVDFTKDNTQWATYICMYHNTAIHWPNDVLKGVWIICYLFLQHLMLSQKYTFLILPWISMTNWINFSWHIFTWYCLLTPYNSLLNYHTFQLGEGHGSWQGSSAWYRLWLMWSIARQSCCSASQHRCPREPSPEFLAIPLSLLQVGHSAEPVINGNGQSLDYQQIACDSDQPDSNHPSWSSQHRSQRH